VVLTQKTNVGIQASARFDKGNNSQQNFSTLQSQGLAIDFVGTLTPSHHRDLLRIPLERYTENFGQFRVHSTKKKVFGEERTIVLTYNAATARRQERIFEFQMKRAMKEAKAFFETIANEPTREVEAQMRAYLKTTRWALHGRFATTSSRSGTMAGGTCSA